MKTTSLVPLFSLVCASFAWAAESDPASRPLQVYPKNLARQHLGSNLFLFNPTTQSYGATEASAAWLDDDVTTGSPVLAGKQHYLLVLSEPESLTNFSLSARPATGTITLYGGDEPAPPGAKSWMVIAKDIPFDSVNDKKLAKSFSRFAKYVLIETDIAEPGALYSLYLYSDKPAVNYTLRKREQPIDARAIFGPFVNNQTNFNADGLYTGARVTYANSPDGFTAWQKGIDDNPESSLIVAASPRESGAVISYGASRSPSRVSVLTDPGTKGQLDIYAVPAPAEEGVTTVSTAAKSAAAPAPRSALALDGLTPAATIVFDGTNPRASMDLPAVEAGQLALRWSPINPADKLVIHEFNTFGGLTLNDYEVGLAPAVVAEGIGDGNGKGRDSSKDGKDIHDPKKNPEPVALGPGNSPYLPASLGFPPILGSRLLPPLEPESN